MTTLADLRPGDDVAIIEGGHYRSSVKIKRVDRVGKTTLVVGPWSYMRSNGIMRGMATHHAAHLIERAEVVTDDLRREALRQQVQGIITSGKRGLTLDQLRRIRAIMEEVK